MHPTPRALPSTPHSLARIPTIFTRSTLRATSISGTTWWPRSPTNCRVKSAHRGNPAAKFWEAGRCEGVFTAQTGVPYTPLLGEDIAGNGDQFAADNQRPNLVPGPAALHRFFGAAVPCRQSGGIRYSGGRHLRRCGPEYPASLRAPAARPGPAEDHEGQRANLRAVPRRIFQCLNHANFATPAASGNNLLTAGSSFGLSQEMANASSGGLLLPLFNRAARAAYSSLSSFCFR